MFERMTLSQIAAYLEEAATLSPEEEQALLRDRRAGVRILLQRYRRRVGRRQREERRLHRMLAEERALLEQGIRLIAGVDEAGRGPLAGPIVAAAVILPPGKTIAGLDDSKKLLPEVRERLYQQIREQALATGIGVCSVSTIDRLNIHGATMQAMRKALAALPVQPEMVLVDGFPIRGLDLPQKALKGGDGLSLSIAAASVLAKVTRDRLMLKLHRRYPHYQFDRNKGYPTPEHRRAIADFGPCPVHRRSFRLTPEEEEGEAGWD